MDYTIIIALNVDVKYLLKMKFGMSTCVLVQLVSDVTVMSIGKYIGIELLGRTNPGLFVPLYFRSWERKVHRENFLSRGTVVPWNIRSLELSLLGSECSKQGLF